MTLIKKVKKIAKKLVNQNRKKSIGIRKIMLVGIGLISAIGIATKMILTPKSQKKITSIISKDTKNTMDNIADKSDEVKSIIEEGYHNINKKLQKVGKKITKELE